MIDMSFRVLNRGYDFESTASGSQMRPVFRRETKENGEPYLVIDHYEDIQELIESAKPLDIRELVRQAQLAGEEYDPAADTYIDVSQFGDINDIVDRTLAFQRLTYNPVQDDSVQVEKNEVKTDES